MSAPGVPSQHPSVVEDVDTCLDLGLYGCRKCYTRPSDWIPNHSTIPYLTEVIPAEIRAIILEYAVLCHGGSQPIKADIITQRAYAFAIGDDGERNEDQLYSPTLIAHEAFVVLSLTSRLLNVEASPIFWSKNRFSFHDIIGLRVFLDGVTLAQRHMMHEIIFVYDQDGGFFETTWALDLLSECSLRKLTMALPNNTVAGAAVCFPDDLCVFANNNISFTWENTPFKIVHAKNWVCGVLDWEPASLISTNSSPQALENAREIVVASDILSKKVSIADVPGPLGEHLRHTQEMIMAWIEAKPLRWPNLTEEIVRTRVRAKGWIPYTIASSEWDRLGGATICSACHRKSLEAQKKVAKPIKKRQRRTNKTKSIGTCQSVPQPPRRLLGEIQNVERQPSAGGKSAFHN